MTTARHRFRTGDIILLVVIAAEAALFAGVAPNFATTGNFFEITRLSVELGLLAIALTPVIVTGGIDLSVGAMMGLAAVVFGSASRDWGLHPIRSRTLRRRGRRRWRVAERGPRRQARHPTAHRHTRNLLALSRHRRGHYAGSRELQRLPVRISLPWPGIPLGLYPGTASGVCAGLRGVCRPAASIGHRPRAVRDRIRASRRALRRNPGRAASRAGVPPVGPERQPGRNHLCRAPRTGALRCREWI